ncbi:MAG: phage portal protein, partial [bacterium]
MMMTSRLLLFGSVRLVQEDPAVLTIYPASPGERLPEKISPDMVYELALFDPSAAHPRRIFPPAQVIEPVWRAHFAGWQQIANSLEQGSVKRGFLRKKTPSASPEERGQLIQKVREALSTAEQAGRPLYLEGDVDWVEIAQSLIDSGVLETLGRTREEIGQVFGVPPALLSSAENRYANYREQLLAFYEWTLRPLWRLFAGGLTNFLSTRPQLQGVIDRVEFDEQDCWLVSELQLQNALAIRNLTGVPIMTINEGRELAGLPPFESPMADQLWMPISLYPVGGSSGESTEQQTRILVQSPKKEIRLLKWQAYERQRAGWERQMAKKIGKLLDEILQETLDNLPDLIKTKTITVPYDQQKAIDRAVKIRMALYPAMWADGIENGRVKVGRMEQAEDRALRPEAIAELRKRAKAFAEKVDTETAKKLREILEQGLTENWELDDFVKAVQQSIVLDWSRAIRIARTEVGGCLNGGELQFYQDEGIERKEWLATQDDRVRDPHLEADGQI